MPLIHCHTGRTQGKRQADHNVGVRDSSASKLIASGFFFHIDATSLHSKALKSPRLFGDCKRRLGFRNELEAVGIY